MTKSIEERFEESFKYGGNSQYLDHLYEQYIQDPSKIKPEWKKYFDSIQNGHNDQSHKLIIEKFFAILDWFELKQYRLSIF